MKFLNRTPFVFTFLLFFSGVLILLGSIQAIFGALRLYNPSEESYEQLQQYPIYNSNENVSQKNSTIRVTIAPKPSQPQTDVYVFIQKTEQDRTTALLTLPQERAEHIEQKIQDILSEAPVSTPEEDQQKEEYISPIDVQVKPKTSPMPTGYMPTIDAVLEGLFFEEVLWGFPLVVDINRTSPRGQMANQSVTLSGKIRSLNEMAKVLVHELGHMIDIYFLRHTGEHDDISDQFYQISWKEPTVVHSGISENDFVSGYAITNQYEDFAESFTMYIFHNDTFAQRAQDSTILKEKFDFFQQQIFGDYFLESSYEITDIPPTLWDVTKIAIKSNALQEVFTLLKAFLRVLV